VPDDVSVQIDRFVTFYLNAIDSTADLKDHQHGLKLRKICIVALLDAVSKSIFPTRDNRHRFTELVRRFGNWPEASRVSLPHLSALLSKVPDPEFEALRLSVNEALASWTPGTVLKLDRDLEYERARSMWPKDQALRTPVGSITLEHMQHLNLLYTYRNSLVHEFRDLSENPLGDDRPYPRYVHVDPYDEESGFPRWQLFYTSGFFHALGRTVLENVGEYLRTNKLDPMRHLSTGEYWLEDLCR